MICLPSAARGRRKNCPDCVLARPVPLRVKAKLAVRKITGRDQPHWLDDPRRRTR